MKVLRFRRSLSGNIISAIILLIMIFSVIVSIIGYMSFTETLKREYLDMAYRSAETATALVDGDRIDDYIEEGESGREYRVVQQRMDTLCNKMNLTLIYTIKVDTADYGRFVSVFESVNKNAEPDYSRWEAGYYRETTNEEYREIYRDLYENGTAYREIFRTTDLRGKEPHVTALVPVKDSDGETTAIMCVQRPMDELTATGRKPFLINLSLAAAVLCVFVSALGLIYVRKEFVIPLKTIADEATRFAEERTAPAGTGSRPISKIDEISALAFSVRKMENDMLSYIEYLRLATIEKERIGTELNIARTIQESSIPSKFPPFPDRDEFDLYASMTPAKEVGGDFYDFFFIDSDHLAIVIADVSGKGIPAALFMMVTKIVINDRAVMGGTPADVFRFINEGISDHNDADMFVTVWLGILEISTGRMIASNAGHDDPAICRKNGKFEIVKNQHGPVIGAMRGLKYTNFELQFEPGDKIFLYTDGVPEATDSENNMFLFDGMLSSLNSVSDASPREIIEKVFEDTLEFSGDAAQFDDITMLCLKINDKTEPKMKTLKVEAKKENLETVMDFVNSFLEEHDCGMKKQMQVELCIEEVFVNIASYAYPEGTGYADVAVSCEDGEATFVFKDSGVAYNPLEKADPDITLSAEDRQIGGLGIFLVKKNMDSVEYSNEDGMNILTMKKRID